MLGRTRAGKDGRFTIRYREPSRSAAVLYLIAKGPVRPSRHGHDERPRSPIRLATVLGERPFPERVLVNERSTVATAYAMAQFIKGRRIGGPSPGLPNAAATVRNLVDLRSGGVGSVLGSFPNGDRTSTMPTFNSLANLLATCVQDEGNCSTLFGEATKANGKSARNTLQAAVNVAHNPGQNVPDLFALSQTQSTYEPALADDAVSSMLINSWVLGLRYNGGGGSFGQKLDGPGNIAFDSDGNAWVNNNYEFSLDVNPDPPVCGSTKVIKLTPTGGSAPGAPYGGMDGPNSGDGAGGLYGAGFGIGVDPDENVWISSFGFQGATCTNDAEALFISVSKFSPEGDTLSFPDGDPANDVPGGFGSGLGSAADISAPQGIVSDKDGSIWIANCANDSVTKLPLGDPVTSENYPDTGLLKPFDIAFDHNGHAWVTGNGSSSVVELDRDGNTVGDPVMQADFPMGIASDINGNLWVANAGLPNPPCPAKLGEDEFDDGGIGVDGDLNENASVTLIEHDGGGRQVTLYDRDGRDGLRWPWGIAVDGDNNVWVANFAGRRVMQLCGVDEKRCPPGVATGDPISPPTGYVSHPLQRNTALDIDPSGNVWMTNNWIIEGFVTPNNPGGHELVVFIGLAAPVKTPLIGPVERAE
jgi:hypothetical protein